MPITPRRHAQRASDLAVSQFNTGLNRLAEDALLPGAAACTLLYAFYTVVYALQPSARGSSVGLVMSALTAGLFLGLRLGFHRRPVPVGWINPIGGVFGVSIGLNCLISQAATGNAELSPNLMLCIVTLPLFLLDARWLVGVIAPLVAGWFVVQNATRAGTTWHVQSYPLIASVVVAALVYGVRRETHRRLEEARLELRRAAERDALTGVYNRRGFLAAGDAVLARARESGQTAVVLFLDVDGLKGINDSYGHAAGDEILRSAATAIGAAFGPDDVVGRLGGDEFAVLIVGASDGDSAGRRVRESAAAARVVAGRTELSLSVGAALMHPRGAETLEHLLNSADRDMYAGRDRRLAG